MKIRRLFAVFISGIMLFTLISGGLAQDNDEPVEIDFVALYANLVLASQQHSPSVGEIDSKSICIDQLSSSSVLMRRDGIEIACDTITSLGNKLTELEEEYPLSGEQGSAMEQEPDATRCTARVPDLPTADYFWVMGKEKQIYLEWDAQECKVAVTTDGDYTIAAFYDETEHEWNMQRYSTSLGAATRHQLFYYRDEAGYGSN